MNKEEEKKDLLKKIYHLLHMILFLKGNGDTDDIVLNLLNKCLDNEEIEQLIAILTKLKKTMQKQITQNFENKHTTTKNNEKSGRTGSSRP